MPRPRLLMGWLMLIALSLCGCAPLVVGGLVAAGGAAARRVSVGPAS
jgi:hypothetical protein